MRLHLDYDRVIQDNTPRALRDLLLTAFGNDLERRVKTAFPEYFTDKEPSVVHVSSLAKRAAALLYEGLDVEDKLQETLSWFGLKLLYFEGRTDGGDHRAIDNGIVLPRDFAIERGNDYDGLTDPWPWVTVLPGVDKMVYILKVDLVDDPDLFPHTKFFMLGVLYEKVKKAELTSTEVNIPY